MRHGKKLVVHVAQRVAPLVSVQGLPSFFSNMYCLFDPSSTFVGFSVQNSGDRPIDHVVVMTIHLMTTSKITQGLSPFFDWHFSQGRAATAFTPIFRSIRQKLKSYVHNKQKCSKLPSMSGFVLLCTTMSTPVAVGSIQPSCYVTHNEHDLHCN